MGLNTGSQMVFSHGQLIQMKYDGTSAACTSVSVGRGGGEVAGTAVKRFTEAVMHNFSGTTFVHNGAVLFTMGKRNPLWTLRSHSGTVLCNMTLMRLSREVAGDGSPPTGVRDGHRGNVCPARYF